MKKWICLGVLVLAGCDTEITRYSGSVNIHRTNGRPVSVEVVFPIVGDGSKLRNRSEVKAMIDQMEAMLVDIKSAYEQFPVEENISPESETFQTPN